VVSRAGPVVRSGVIQKHLLIRKRTHLGPYSRPMQKALWLSYGVGGFL